MLRKLGGCSRWTIALLGAAGLMLPQTALAKKKQPPAPEPPPPVAKSGPSFEATRDWMISTLTQYGGDRYADGLWDINADVAISNACILTFQYVHYQTDYKNGSEPFSSYRVTMPLGAVTSVQIQQYHRGSIQADEINVATGNISAITETQSRDYNSHMSYPDSAQTSYSFDMERAPAPVAGQPAPDDPDDMAKRLTTAFQHMVDICKGTWQAPAQQSQPF